jgi:chaperone modulatory protein CbpM
MRIEVTEATWLDERAEFSLTQLAELSGLSHELLRQLVEYEAILPADPAAPQPMFKARDLVGARAACRLRDDFELEAPGLALVLTLLERIRHLEARVQALECQFPGPHRLT